MDSCKRTCAADSLLSSNTSYSGSTASIRLHPKPAYGSRMSVSALPSLPIDLGIKSDHTEKQVSTTVDDEISPEDSYVEFDLSASKNKKTEDDNILRERVISVNLSKVFEEEKQVKELDKEGAGLAVDKEEDEDDFFNWKTSNWKSMKTVTELDYYDDRGELEFASANVLNNVGNISGSRGYTKIDTEEQVAKYAELDKRTDFLFQARRNLNNRSETSAYAREDLGYSSEEVDSEYEGDDNVDSNETLQTTKSMLTDSQKLAYVGIIKLIIVDMATELAKITYLSSKKVAKELSSGQRNFANWSVYIMSKLYEHMDLTEEEQKMIENLSIHGLDVSDLSNSFIEYAVEELSNCKYTTSTEPTQSKNTVSNSSEPNAESRFDLRWVLICDLFLLLLSDGYYDSRSRSLLIKFADNIKISKLEIYQFERRLIDSLELDTHGKSIDNNDEKLNDKAFIEKYIKKNRKKRLAYIGLATLGGSLAIGLSAGILAPVIGAGLAAGLTTVGITGTSGFLAGVGGSAIITTSGIVAGAKVGSTAGARRLGDVHTFELKPLHNNKRTNLIVTVSGWMNGRLDDVRLPFSTIDPVMGDMFSLSWEPEMLQSMGQTINILASEALTTSIQQILGATILTALMSAIQLPMALSKLSYLLDNPWNVSLDRAWKAGKILADTLISGNLGVRPITLVGFSLGARLIYSCLIELAKRGGYGLIENVIILGNPITVKDDQLALVRSVVSGRFINGYSKKDWILGYLFRATGGGISAVAGLSPISTVHGIENIDCTDLVEGHMSYRKAIPKILKAMNWEVLSEEFAEIEEPDLEQGEKTRKLIIEFDEARAKMKQEMESDPNKKRTWKNWFKPKQKEWWEIYGEGSQQEINSSPSNSRNKDDSEYMESDQEGRTETSIFNVNALLKEVNDIEKLATKDPETLETIKKDVDTVDKPLRPNEDLEEESSSFVNT